MRFGTEKVFFISKKNNEVHLLKNAESYNLYMFHYMAFLDFWQYYIRSRERMAACMTPFPNQAKISDRSRAEQFFKDLI